VNEHLTYGAYPLKVIRDSFLKLTSKAFVNLGVAEIDDKLREFLESLDDSLYVIVEYPYVDKVYRDSFYSHYASKHSELPRHALRISLFGTEISKEDIFDPNKIKEIRKSYLGYFVIRPTKASLLGRNYISPKALKDQNFVTCLCRISTSVFGIPLSVDAFPHSTQDKIVATCAETSIWSIMEYFGNKYSDYSPALTSKITNVINETFYQRSLPSNGLTALQISSALRAFGFSTRVYRKGNETDVDSLYRTISDYVESGISVVIAVTGDGMGGHALLLTGHSEIDLKTIKLIKPLEGIGNKGKIQVFNKELLFFDSADFAKDFISVDDNKRVYHALDLKKPLAQYSDSKFHNGAIKSVIVPLQNRIYMESKTARKLMFELFQDSTYGIKADEIVSKESWIFRLFLTSTKSFKKRLRETNENFDKQVDLFLLKSHFPRFLWIAEFSRESRFREGKGEIRYILDATGDDTPDSLLFAQFPKRFAYFSTQKNDVNWLTSNAETFDLYRNNLKGAWNKWNSN